MPNIYDLSICNWDTATFLIFSDNVTGNFLYYSHFFPSIAGLIIAIFVLKSDHRNKAAQALLFMTTMFAVWCYMALITWATERPDLMMFVWGAMNYPELLMYLGALYFIYAFYNGKFPPFKVELGIFLVFIPMILLAPTSLNMEAFIFTDCARNAVEGPMIAYYLYGFEYLIIASILYLTIQERRKNKANKREVTIVSVGILSFLLLFSSGNFVGTFFNNWMAGQVGLFGMPIFVALLGYILVRYQTFRVKLLATEALMAGQLLLLVSLLFVRTIESAQILAIITIVFFSILGVLLVKSVRKEVEQRQQIQKLATNLKNTNEQLKIVDRQKSEFVSIASHQLRSPLTAIRGYTSMMLDGNFGQAPDAMREPISRIHESAKLMALSIEDFLNVSRIESGNIKYDTVDFNLKEQAEHIVDDLRPEAIHNGIMMVFRSNLTSKGVVNADIGKTQQILHNMINNALKYTKQGSITVFVHEDLNLKKLYVEIIDTGIGMSADTISGLFQKFARAKNANSINITGTGLGLFVAKEMAVAMGGDITAFSEGEGHGSHFVLTLPLVG
jgi:signal transduction histidine kinase